jgi:hypothetical protein
MANDPVHTLERMQGLLRAWEQTDDRRAIFLGCYRLMTLNMLEAIQQQEFHDPIWVERLLHRFAEYYFIALDAFEQRSPNIPAIWRQTFEAACRSDTQVMQHLLLGVNAHINYDLIFTLVDMLQDEWPLLSGDLRQERYADHSHVNEVIYRTVDIVQETVIVPRQPLMEIVDRLLGPVDEWAISSLIRHWRDQVWQDAVALLESPDPAQRRLLTFKMEAEALQRGELILKVA